MTALDRVPGPRSPFGGWAGRAIALVAIGLVVAIAKPWGDGGPQATWSPRTTAGPSEGTPVPAAHAVPYDGERYPTVPPPAAWAILTPDAVAPLDFLARDAGTGGDGFGTTPDTIVSGPVVAIGAGGPLLSLAIAHPVGAEIRTARLWRLDDGQPVRIEVEPRPSPWPGAAAIVLARPAGGDGDLVDPWEPGLYRLDLLLGPDLRARSVMLSVDGPRVATGDLGPRTGAGGSASLEPDRDRHGFLDPMLALLPERATLWSASAILSGWNRDGAAVPCTVVEIWQASTPDAPCWPVPLGPTEALGVNLPAGSAVTALELRRLDPLPGGVATTSRTRVHGRPGLALVRAPADGLPDGVYRLEATLAAGGSRSWYVEVGPIGRAVAGLNEASTSR